MVEVVSTRKIGVATEFCTCKAVVELAVTVFTTTPVLEEPLALKLIFPVPPCIVVLEALAVDPIETRLVPEPLGVPLPMLMVLPAAMVVLPVPMFMVSVAAVLAAVAMLMVSAEVLMPLAMLTVAPDRVALAILTVEAAPVPLPMRTVWAPVDWPRIMLPVATPLPPMVMVEVLVPLVLSILMLSALVVVPAAPIRIVLAAAWLPMVMVPAAPAWIATAVLAVPPWMVVIEASVKAPIETRLVPEPLGVPLPMLMVLPAAMVVLPV